MAGPSSRLSTAASDDAPTPLVGRRHLLARLVDAIDDGRSVALVGPAGVGKSRLAIEAAQRADREVCRGAALDFLQTHPYFALSRVIGRALPRGDAAAACAEVRTVVGRALLVLEDLQWADVDTVEALPTLVAGGPVVVTVRPGGDMARRTLKHFEVIGEVLDVEPLDLAASVELARVLLPHTPVDHADELARASGGIPLALEAVVHAHARGDVARQHALRAVVEGCPHDARVTLARIGLHDDDVDGDAAGVADLVDRRLATIEADGRVTAAAVPFTELALASLAPSERADLHRRRAAQTEDAGEAAAHWAAAGERQLAYTTALEAAEHALTRNSRAQLLTIAAHNAPDDTVWATTRLAVAEWLELAALDETRPLVARLDGHEPPTRADAIDRELIRASFALHAAQPHEVIERTNDIEATYDVDLAPEQRSALLLMRSAARGELFDIPGTMADARAAVEVGKEHGLSTTRARMILAAIDVVIGDERWRDELPATFRRAADLGELSTAFEAARLWSLAEFFSGGIDAGVAACNEAIALAERQNSRMWVRAFEGLRAGNLSIAGLCPPDVVDELRRVVDDPAVGRFRHNVSVLLAIAESDLGHISRADELVATAIASAKRWRSQNLEGLLWARTEIAWNAGRLDECLAASREQLAHGIPLDFGTAAAAVTVRWVQWERDGCLDDAPAPLVIYPVQRGLLDEALALELLCQAGREREAAEAFLRAAELHDVYLRRHALRCRWAAGEALRRAGDIDDAVARLKDVQQTCIEHGFDPLRRRIEASLRRVDPSAGVPTHRGGDGSLTPREREVLALVREGLSTAAIAARLHVQPSTVESHIRKSKRRLGARTRREAALLVLDQPD